LRALILAAPPACEVLAVQTLRNMDSAPRRSPNGKPFGAVMDNDGSGLLRHPHTGGYEFPIFSLSIHIYTM